MGRDSKKMQIADMKESYGWYSHGGGDEAKKKIKEETEGSMGLT